MIRGPEFRLVARNSGGASQDRLVTPGISTARGKIRCVSIHHAGGGLPRNARESAAARQYRAPHRCPRNTQSASAGSRWPASDSDVPWSRRKTSHTALRRTHRTRRCPVLIQSLIERMPAGRGQLTCRDPQPRRPCPIVASTHGHARHCSTADRFWRMVESTTSTSA
jgi:hypothetical protein